MTTKTTLIASVILSASAAIPGWASLPAPALRAAPLAVASADPVNTTCPISGKALDKDSPTREYKGRTIAFCCERCQGKWDAKSDADKAAIFAKYVPADKLKEADAPKPAAADAAAAPASDHPAAKTARAYLAACAAADEKALNALFLDNGRATILENAGDEGTWETYRDHHLLPELKEMPGFTMTVEKESVQTFGATSIVRQVGSFMVPTPNHPDAPRKVLAAVTYVVVEEAGAPKIAHLHWSSRAEKRAEAAPELPKADGHKDDTAKPAHSHDK